MKIEIYTKSKDIEIVTKHLKKFLAQHLKGKNRIELKKVSKIDILNHALSDKNYKQIIKFYTDSNLLKSALIHITELLTNGIEIRVIFKYSSHGNIILINHNEIMNFIKKNDEIGRNAVNRLYQQC